MELDMRKGMDPKITPCLKELPGEIRCGKSGYKEIQINTDIGRMYTVLCQRHYEELPEEEFSFKR